MFVVSTLDKSLLIFYYSDSVEKHGRINRKTKKYSGDCYS